MDRIKNEEFVRNFFEEARERNMDLVAEFTDDAATVMDQAARIFDEMIPDMAYVDSPHKPMADSVFFLQCHTCLIPCSEGTQYQCSRVWQDGVDQNGTGTDNATRRAT